MRCSSSHCSTPMCARPRAAPPSSTSPIFCPPAVDVSFCAVAEWLTNRLAPRHRLNQIRDDMKPHLYGSFQTAQICDCACCAPIPTWRSPCKPTTGIDFSGKVISMQPTGNDGRDIELVGFAGFGSEYCSYQFCQLSCGVANKILKSMISQQIERIAGLLRPKDEHKAAALKRYLRIGGI